MKLHRTYAVYPDGSWKRNAVESLDLADHIQYNREARPGRALVVDGVVVLTGSVSPERMARFLDQLPDHNTSWSPEVPTVPYG